MASAVPNSHASAPATQLSGIERAFLAIPMLAGIFFGLVPLFLPQALAAWTGYPGNDPYIYSLAGAATFGYAVALGLGIRQQAWAPVRLLVVAVLTFNVASLYICAQEIASGTAQPIVYLILGASLLFVAGCTALLITHRAALSAPSDSASWVSWLLVSATILALTFGLLPLLVPTLFGSLFGFKATDLFLYRQAGAATLGYAIMGVCELRSRRWEELRLPVLMGAVFNGVMTAASIVALRRNGQ
jgi:hypothetical protein